MAEIRVPVERLREVSRMLNAKQQEVDSLLQRTIMVITDLSDEWTGLAQTDYSQQFSDQIPPMREHFNEVLKLLSTELRRIADTFEETDENAVGGSGPGTGGGETPPSGGNTPSVVDFSTMKPDEFANYIGSKAQLSDQQTGVPTSVTIAQAALETGWGKHTIGEANNLFGIKGEGPAGSVLVQTNEYVNGEWVTVTAKFAKYHSFEESIAEHAKLIANNPVYAEAMKYTDDPQAFARQLEGVYATDPQYAEKLISIMDKYNLYRFDV